MNTFFLPREIRSIKAPPIKCQGIKTKLVKFIAASIKWDGVGRWIEPFLGSGVVLFNLQPEKALVADTNKHIITFYRDIQARKINEVTVKAYLIEMGAKLLEGGADFYYELRADFNENGGSLPFLFLNRCCFNGLMRFNSAGRFNVPFGHKPHRFSRAYITKIVNQVAWIRTIIMKHDWQFEVADFQQTLSKANPEDFVYMDPPYIGRHTDYYNSWPEERAVELAEASRHLPCGFVLSMWKENKYRVNDHIERCWNEHTVAPFNHFYHVGPSESLRNEMVEALVIRKGFEALKRANTKSDFGLPPLLRVQAAGPIDSTSL